MSTTPDPVLIANTNDMYTAHLESIVTRLRRIADQIEQEGKVVDPRPVYRVEPGPHGLAATRVLHALTWGVANASVDRLIRDASVADAALRVTGTVEPDQ